MQAAKNLELARFLRREQPEYLDWATTCLFYAAIHYVNAFLTHEHSDIPRRHNSDAGDGRTNIVQQHAMLRQIYIDYRHLDDKSRDARYELRMPPKPEFDERLMPAFVRIKNFITAKMGN